MRFKHQKVLSELNEGWDYIGEMKDVEVEQMKGYFSTHHITLAHKLKERKTGRYKTKNPIPTCVSIRSVSLIFRVDD